MRLVVRDYFSNLSYHLFLILNAFKITKPVSSFIIKTTIKCGLLLQKGHLIGDDL